ncbi:MAG TPA: tetratricopeptide repeat protein, partial [Pedomonas sp.]|uniref:tetratricopeptide repeat protein n=1 Tax=Pedomonas sp. TaxID=2976421 RepID=UPI002F3F877D
MRRIDHLLITRPGRACRAAVAVGLLLASAAPVAEAASRKREEGAKTALTAETQVSLGRRFEAKGDTETALGLYQKAVSEKPDNDEALRALIGLAVRTNRASLVLDEAVRLATKRPNDAEAQLWLATALNEKGRPADALAALAEAEKAGSGPMPALMWAQRGIAHDMAGNHLEAQRAFSRAITLNPSDWQLPMRLALSLALQADYPAALRILQMQVNDPLMERPVRETLAIIYALSGQTEQATEIARTATAAELADSQRGYL